MRFYTSRAIGRICIVYEGVFGCEACSESFPFISAFASSVDKCVVHLENDVLSWTRQCARNFRVDHAVVLGRDCNNEAVPMAKKNDENAETVAKTQPNNIESGKVAHKNSKETEPRAKTLVNDGQQHQITMLAAAKSRKQNASHVQHVTPIQNAVRMENNVKSKKPKPTQANASGKQKSPQTSAKQQTETEFVLNKRGPRFKRVMFSRPFDPCSRKKLPVSLELERAMQQNWRTNRCEAVK